MAHGPGWYAYMQGQYEKQQRAAAREDYLVMNSEGDCPKCDGVLLRREGSSGEFLGCSNYPDCTYTKKLKSEKVSSYTSSYSRRSSYSSSTTQKCPKCSGSLRKRSGKFGDFYGCSNYPSCTYTKKV